MKTHQKVGCTLNLKGLVGTIGDKNQLVHYRIVRNSTKYHVSSLSDIANSLFKVSYEISEEYIRLLFNVS